MGGALEQIKNALQRNKLKKFLALILSMALWVYVMGTQNPVIEDSYKVNVKRKNFSAEYGVFFNENEEVKVILSAPRSYFIDYSEKDIRAYIDTSDYGEGEFDIPIETDFPKGFELIKISPETMHVTIEPIIERQMELQIILSGAPKPNTIVKNIDAPKNITVVGPKAKVNTVSQVVGYVGITGDDNDFELNVPVSALDENGRGVTEVRVIPSSVKVYIDIEKSAKKIVPIVADLTPPNGKEIDTVTINPATIEIEGAEDVINGIESLKTVSIIIPENTDTYQKELAIVIPNENLKLNVKKVTVTAKLKK
ncbi:MAG: hypothetical protein IJS81_11305 [Selenomonadaceae bacterium]|nr:hypothetical protein [Selenomonadaceae bacterium]MBQ7630778.1 hypothetical protein [Selenomonadaceae bacterium]